MTIRYLLVIVAEVPSPLPRQHLHTGRPRKAPATAASRSESRSPVSTVRCRLNRLSYTDRASGGPVRRYEHPEPGDLIHVDVTKFGNIPDGGGWRFVGRARGRRHRAATPGKPKNAHYNPKMGHCFVHTVVDDYSRVAYAEIHDDERAVTASGVLRRAVAWFGARGITVDRVISDNGPAYRSVLWAETCNEVGIVPKWTRPYRPQTNGKIERFHRTLADGWAYARH